VLKDCRRITGLDVRHRMGAAFGTKKERVALREIARAFRLLMDAHKAAIGVLRPPRRNTLGDDPAFRVAAEVNHLCAGIRLLIMIGDRD